MSRACGTGEPGPEAKEESQQTGNRCPGTWLGSAKRPGPQEEWQALRCPRGECRRSAPFWVAGCGRGSERRRPPADAVARATFTGAGAYLHPALTSLARLAASPGGPYNRNHFEDPRKPCLF